MGVYRCTRIYLTGDDAGRLGSLLAKLVALLAERGLDRIEPGYDTVTIVAGDVRVEAGRRDPDVEEGEEEYGEAYIEVCSKKRGYSELAQLLNKVLEEGGDSIAPSERAQALKEWM